MIFSATKGIETQNSYPYQSGNNGVTRGCIFNSDTIGSIITNYVLYTSGDENILMNLVASIGLALYLFFF